MRYFKILAAAAIVLVLLGSALVGCQKSTSTGGQKPIIKKTTPKSAAPSRQIDVSETEFKIAPDKITVKKGETVTFRVKNAGTITHVFMLSGMGFVQVEPGETKNLKQTFNSAGTIKYFCNIDAHEQQGMVGELTVK